MSLTPQPERPSHDLPGVVAGGHAKVWLGDEIHYHLPAPPAPESKVLIQSLQFDCWDSRMWNVKPAIDKTCQWVFSHENFQKWAFEKPCDGKRAILRIEGKAGSGKSTIMKEAIGWLEKAFPERLVISYFFNAQSPNELEKSPLGVFRSLTFQLLRANPPAATKFAEMFSGRISGGKVSTAWTVATLENFWHIAILNCCIPPLIVLIDALDEGVEDDVRAMVESCVNLSRRSEAQSGDLAFCFSGRQYPTITIQESLSIVVEEEKGHKQDIERFVLQRLKRTSEDELDSLRSKFLSQSQGVFLWVVLIVERLNKLFDHGSDFKSRLRTLDETPQDLRDVLRDTIMRRSPTDQLLDSSHMQQRIRLFRWMLFSIRTLALPDLQQAVEASSQPEILSMSQGLIEFSTLKTLFSRRTQAHFIHETIRDFLLGKARAKQDGSGFAAEEEFLVNFQPDLCHSAIAETCLLLLSRLTEDLDPDEVRRYPLGRYAARYWWQHLKAIDGPISERVLSLATEFCLNRNKVLVWNQVSNILSRVPSCNVSRSAIFNPSELPTPLHYAAAVGCQDLVRSILEWGIKLDATESRFPSALEIASELGHGRVVQVLLERNPLVYSRPQRIVNNKALLVASRAGHENVVRILLDWNAHFTVDPSYRHSPLVEASKEGHEATVRALLEFRVDIVAGDWQYYQALRHASIRGREEVIQVLVRYGTQFNARMDWYSEALPEAAVSGHVGSVQLLLDAGANINFGGPRGTSLAIATYFGHKAVVKLLLEKGAIASDQEELDRALKVASMASEDQGWVFPPVSILEEASPTGSAMGAWSLSGAHVASDVPKFPQMIDL